MTYLKILMYAREGVQSKINEYRQMQDKALEGAGAHPEAKKLRPSKAASHVPAWQTRKPQKKRASPAPPSQAAAKKPVQKKKPASTEKVVAVTKESIMKKKEDT